MPPKLEVHYRKFNLLIVSLLLLTANIFLIFLETKGHGRELTFAMLDVGQGDALLIESPTGTQVLVDGGPPRKILSRLRPIMSPFDRTIDGIIITNPDQDHIGGLLEVLEKYKVGIVFASGTYKDSKIYQNLEEEIKNKNIPYILARRGMKLDLGGGAAVDILFPDQDVSFWAPNDGSVVSKLTYGDTTVMLTGDATSLTEEIILKNYLPENLQSDILKVGHHGSRTSTSNKFLSAVKPSFALISDGKENKYGHPHPDTLDALNKFGVKIFRTDLLGTIIMKSDGKSEEFSFQE